MRVLMAADVVPDSGGVAAHVTALSEALRARGVDVEHVWADALPGPWKGGLRTLAFTAEVGRRARAGRPDVLHAHTSAGALAHLMAPRSTACVTTSHGDERDLWREEQRWSRRGGRPVRALSRVLVPLVRLPLFTLSVRTADAVIALHEGEASRYARERRVPDSVAVVPNGARRATHPRRPDPDRLVFVGNWIPRKGVDVLVDAFRRIAERRPGSRLVLVGPGPEALRDVPPSLRSAVRATGFLAAGEVGAELSRADLLLHPSRFEGMPLVVLDAMAHGVPCVGSDLAGTRAAAGESAVLVPGDDPARLAVAVLGLLADRPRRDELGRRARERADSLDWDAAVEGTLAQYARAAARRPGRWRSRALRLRAPGGAA